MNYERCNRAVVQEDGGMFFLNIREAYIMPEQVCGVALRTLYGYMQWQT